MLVVLQVFPIKLQSPLKFSPSDSEVLAEAKRSKPISKPPRLTAAALASVAS